MKLCVFDVEGNDLDATKLWCLTAAIYSKGKWRLKTTTNYDEMRSFLLGCDRLVGHNITRWDIPTLERILGIEIKAKLVDTLVLSWYLYPDKNLHGLDDWGKEFGIPKPKIAQNEWKGALPNETEEQFLAKMSHRCEEDVKINTKFLDKAWRDLRNLYDDNDDEVWRLVDYLQFKMNCARAAEKSRWLLDSERCTRVYNELLSEKEIKVAELAEVMPLDEKFKTMERPESLYTKSKTMKKPKVYKKNNGDLSASGKRYKAACESLGLDPEKEKSILIPSTTLSAAGIKWIELLEANGLPETHKDPITYIASSKKGNPNAPQQVKDWLYSYGWKPETFKYDRKDGEPRKTPQIRMEVKGVKTLCYSVRDLFVKEPKLELLEGLSVLTHRIGILKGFLANVDDEGYIMAQIAGLTNTLRFKHKTIVNLPSVGKAYGKDIRGCLIAPEGYELVGSDMSSLEDRTKQHYMWDYDPEYVKEMMTDDFDPHLDLAVVAEFLTEEQAQSHKDWNTYDGLATEANHNKDNKAYKKYIDLRDKENKFGAERGKAKTANYACLPTSNTEVLTRNGWKFIHELPHSNFVDIMLYNDGVDKLEFGKPTHLHKYNNVDVVKMSSSSWSITSTHNHRWLGKVRTGRGKTRRVEYNKVKTTEDIKSEYSILNTAEFNYETYNNRVSLEEFELLGFILSDGHLNFDSSSFSISQSRKKYLSRILSLISSIGIKYSNYTNNSDVDVIGLPMAYARDLYRRLGLGTELKGTKHDFSYIEQFLRCSTDQLSKLLEGFWLGDGTSKGKDFNKDSLEISQNEGNIREAIYTVGVLLGKKVTSKSQLRMINSRYTGCQTIKKEVIKGVDVFCYTVPTGYFLIRQDGITTITGNCVYGAAGATVARAGGMTPEEGVDLVEKYWVRNWSVKDIARDQRVKTCLKGKWLFNPVSKFWYSLRSDKDRFSTLNQGTGVYCFDMWIKNFMEVRYQLTGQMHDEVILLVKKGNRDKVIKLLKDAIKKTNEQLNLNRELDVDVQFGHSYAEIH